MSKRGRTTTVPAAIVCFLTTPSDPPGSTLHQNSPGIASKGPCRWAIDRHRHLLADYSVLLWMDIAPGLVLTLSYMPARTPRIVGGRGAGLSLTVDGLHADTHVMPTQSVTMQPWDANKHWSYGRNFSLGKKTEYHSIGTDAGTIFNNFTQTREVRRSHSCPPPTLLLLFVLPTFRSRRNPGRLPAPTPPASVKLPRPQPNRPCLSKTKSTARVQR